MRYLLKDLKEGFEILLKKDSNASIVLYLDNWVVLPYEEDTTVDSCLKNKLHLSNFTNAEVSKLNQLNFSFVMFSLEENDDILKGKWIYKANKLKV